MGPSFNFCSTKYLFRFRKTFVPIDFFSINHLYQYTLFQEKFVPNVEQDGGLDHKCLWSKPLAWHHWRNLFRISVTARSLVYYLSHFLSHTERTSRYSSTTSSYKVRLVCTAVIFRHRVSHCYDRLSTP